MTHVVLVHGLSGSSRWWRPIVKALEPAHEVHVVDLPRWRTLTEADTWLAEWIDTHVGRAALVGHSLGGLVAANVAGSRPELVEKLVLIAPAGGEAASTRRAHVLPLVRAVTVARPRLLAHLVRDAVRAGPRTLWRATGEAVASTVGNLDAVQAPTLVVWGERDRLLPVTRADFFASAITGARTVVLPAAGHVPMFEAPDELSAALLEFLG